MSFFAPADEDDRAAAPAKECRGVKSAGGWGAPRHTIEVVGYASGGLGSCLHEHKHFLSETSLELAVVGGACARAAAAAAAEGVLAAGVTVIEDGLGPEGFAAGGRNLTATGDDGDQGRLQLLRGGAVVGARHGSCAACRRPWLSGRPPLSRLQATFAGAPPNSTQLTRSGSLRMSRSLLSLQVSLRLS